MVVLSIYRYLLETLDAKEEESNSFGFVDPAMTYNCERQSCVPYLMERLKTNADRTLLIPYNPG